MFKLGLLHTRFSRVQRQLLAELRKEAADEYAPRSVTEVCKHLKLYRGVLPSLLLAQSQEDFASRNLINEFLFEVSTVYRNFECGLNPVDDDGKAEDTRFYQSEPEGSLLAGEVLWIRDSDLQGPVRQLLLTRPDISVHDVLRDLQFTENEVAEKLRWLLPNDVERAAVIERYRLEEEALAQVEVQIREGLPAPRSHEKQMLFEWIHATFGSNVFLGMYLGAIQRFILYTVAFVCAMVAAVDDSTRHVAWGLGLILMLALFCLGDFGSLWQLKPPDIKTLQRRTTPGNLPIDTLYWLKPRITASYFPAPEDRRLCAWIGLASVVAILWFATSVFR